MNLFFKKLQNRYHFLLLLILSLSVHITLINLLSQNAPLKKNLVTLIFFSDSKDHQCLTKQCSPSTSSTSTHISSDSHPSIITGKHSLTSSHAPRTKTLPKHATPLNHRSAPRLNSPPTQNTYHSDQPPLKKPLESFDKKTDQDFNEKSSKMFNTISHDQELQNLAWKNYLTLTPYYPHASRVKEEEGVVTLWATLIDGHIEAQIIESSRFQQLDHAALQIVKSAKIIKKFKKPLKINLKFQLK